MPITLGEMLDLIGRLDDSPGEDTPRERFRRYLARSLTTAGQIRDYVEECLRTSGDQYNRALQDLVNFTGRFLGFVDVAFGRYQGVRGQIGFDGHWTSPTGFHIVVEVKTTDVFSIRTSTLMDYVNQLITERTIPNWESALGLYVVGRPDAELRQLENAIVAERRAEQLRIISVNHLLSLAEMMQAYAIPHDDVLAVLRPSAPTIDPIVELMTRLVADRQVDPTYQEGVAPQVHPVTEARPELTPTLQVEPAGEGEAQHWLTPVATDEEQRAEQVIDALVGGAGIYAFGERTPGRSAIRPGDRICFYASAKGVVAHATVASLPERRPRPEVRHADQYPWTFQLGDVSLYLDHPVVLNEQKRSELDAFANRDPARPWAWLVQATRKLTAHDFDLLTRQ